MTVEAGITLRELGPQLAARGLAMENQGDVDPQTIAGAIATATHGTGARFRNLSAQVVALRLVTAGGEVVDVRGGDELLAARVSLGALGAISAVTLRCVPAFTIHRVDEPRPLDDVLGRFDELVDGSDHFELFVFPYTRTALTLTSRRTDAEPRPAGAVAAFVRDELIENGALGLACRAGRRFPAAIPAINRGIARSLSRAEHLDASHRVYAHDRRVRFTEMEYGLPREHVPAAVERVLATIERRRLPIGFPIEVRAVAPDDSLLSHGRGARDRLRRRAPVPRDGVRELLPRRRGDHGRVRRPAPLGQAPLPVGRHAAPALPRLGPLRRRPRPARPGAQVRERLPAPRAGCRAGLSEANPSGPRRDRWGPRRRSRRR